jgi:hypothetical protein
VAGVGCGGGSFVGGLRWFGGGLGVFGVGLGGWFCFFRGPFGVHSEPKYTGGVSWDFHSFDEMLIGQYHICAPFHGQVCWYSFPCWNERPEGVYYDECAAAPPPAGQVGVLEEEP